MVLPIPLNIPPDLGWVACCGGTVVCWGCGLEVVAELLGGGDLEPPLEPPPLGIVMIRN
jgi:hypothetical protein